MDRKEEEHEDRKEKEHVDRKEEEHVEMIRAMCDEDSPYLVCEGAAAPR